MQPVRAASDTVWTSFWLPGLRPKGQLSGGPETGDAWLRALFAFALGGAADTRFDDDYDYIHDADL